MSYFICFEILTCDCSCQINAICIWILLLCHTFIWQLKTQYLNECSWSLYTFTRKWQMKGFCSFLFLPCWLLCIRFYSYIHTIRFVKSKIVSVQKIILIPYQKTETNEQQQSSYSVKMQDVTAPLPAKRTGSVTLVFCYQCCFDHESELMWPKQGAKVSVFTCPDCIALQEYLK